MPAFIIDQPPIPATIDAPDAADFIAAATVANDVEAYEYGLDELRYNPVEVLPFWQDPGGPRHLFVAREDGMIVARGIYEVQVDAPADAWADVQVLLGFRRQGIGSALLETIELAARADGRSKLITYAASREAPGERLPSPTGFGSVPLANGEVQFLLGHRFRLEQVERGSRLQLPVKVELRQAPGRAGTDYRVHTWRGGTPERWLEDIAILHTRMTTDAPTAGLEEPEDVYTIDRVRELERAEATSPRTPLVAVVEHLPTGRLAGFTKLTVPAEPERSVTQEDTLVIREHRGHGLGMLLKLANLERLQSEYPGHPSVITFNAEENRYMLQVNEALGFVPIGYEGAWRKDL